MSLTGKLGKYQNTIPRSAGLSGLPITRYERLFKIYTQPNNNKQFYFYNILNKLEFPTNIESSLLSSFTVGSRTPLTTVSYNLYKDIDSWWILYLLNKKTLGRQFYVEGGQQLQYIIPNRRELIYNQITNYTVHNNRHY